MRNEVQQLIGDEAESLAWLFCMIRRETLYQNPGPEGEFRVQHRLTDEWLPLTKTEFQDLLTLTLANTLEAFPRCSGWSVATSQVSPQLSPAVSGHRYSIGAKGVRPN
jgi:hypothetical protein